MKRGEIYYIERASQFGSEQIAGRPAIVVSNDNCNFNSEVIEVVYLTTAPKVDLPTHVTVRSTGKPSIALCEQITSVSVSRVGSFVGKCTDVEMALVDQALATSLSLERTSPSKVNTIVRKEAPNTDPLIKNLETELARRTQERDIWESLYNNLLDKMLQK